MADKLDTKARRKRPADNDEDDDSKIFPQRLMEVLSDERNADAICWLPHGRSFLIKDREKFAEKIMPRFFPRKAKYSSFTRKLNRWNFVRVSSGPELGSWYHEFFIRAKPHLAAQMFCKNARAKLAMASDLPTPRVPESSPVSVPEDPLLVLPQETMLPQQGPQMFANSMPAALPVCMNNNFMPNNSFGLMQQQDFAPQDMAAKQELLSMAYGTQNMMLLEQQIQMMQQEQAQRVMIDRLLASNNNSNSGMMQQQVQQQQQELKMEADLQAARVLRMRQLMSMGVRQRQAQSFPSNGRASAA